MGRVGTFFCLPFCFFASIALADTNGCRVKTLSEITAGLPALNAHIESKIKETSVEGVSLVILSEGRVLFEKAYGDGTTEPRFQAASISKPVAAFAALKLVEQGKLSLDEPLSHFVATPYLPPQPFADLVTLRTILVHTSGMGTDVEGIDREIYFKPGTEYRYSGAGFRYLQQAMEDVTQNDFNSLMTEFMTSLGMKQSTFDLDYEGTHWIAAPYSLVSTPRELGLFFDEMAHPRPENRAVAKLLTTAVIKLDEENDRSLGVVMTPCGDDVSLNHSGKNFSIHRSQADLYLKSRIGAVVMTRGKDTSGLPQALVKMAIGGY